MRVFICTDHDCVYPVGVASVIIAENKTQAIWLLDIELKKRGLKGIEQKPFTVQEIDTSAASAKIIQDGNY